MLKIKFHPDSCYSPAGLQNPVKIFVRDINTPTNLLQYCVQFAIIQIQWAVGKVANKKSVHHRKL